MQLMLWLLRLHVAYMTKVFGRRTTMLSALGLFAFGSALCGAAQNMSWLIAARSEFRLA